MYFIKKFDKTSLIFINNLICIYIHIYIYVYIFINGLGVVNAM